MKKKLLILLLYYTEAVSSQTFYGDFGKPDNQTEQYYSVISDAMGEPVNPKPCIRDHNINGDSAKIKKQNRFFLSYFFAPNYIFSTLPSYGYTSWTNRYGEIQYGFGLSAKLKLGRSNNYFVTGLSYDFLKWVGDYSYSTYVRRDEFDYSLLSIPVSIISKIGSKKWSFYLNYGLQLSILIDNHHKSFPSNYESQLFENGSKIIFLAAGPGLRYRISDKVSMFMESQFFQAALPLIYSETLKYASTGYHFLRYGKINIGFSYYFK